MKVTSSAINSVPVTGIIFIISIIGALFIMLPQVVAT